MLKIFAVLVSAAFLVACEPGGRTPGQWLKGTVVDTLPQDWTFTDEYPEIFVQVATPYLIPHSVTIWCAQVNGELFIGARDPQTKNWVGWIENDNNIRLKIGDNVYDATAVELADDETLVEVQSAYAHKYNLGGAPSGGNTNFRYWSITPRSY